MCVSSGDVTNGELKKKRNLDVGHSPTTFVLAELVLAAVAAAAFLSDSAPAEAKRKKMISKQKGYEKVVLTYFK